MSLSAVYNDVCFEGVSSRKPGLDRSKPGLLNGESPLATTDTILFFCFKVKLLVNFSNASAAYVAAANDDADADDEKDDDGDNDDDEDDDGDDDDILH
ncbi:hypothetical protein ElyMa_004199400 [Elysia marginata]|uniref:Uncharacterized protein n=1 Tax=Elysia marginata TaxID=1093978 RepID=A0AAV4GPD7_9GAST|nr:hypothetical protein ElyMa_004199400 [Elysia marginata]